MLRNRDIAAAVLALILTRMAWNDQAENLSATIHLSFYFPFVKHQVAPSPFDVDGDGTAEALVTIKPTSSNNSNNNNNKNNDWVLQVLDMKPLHSSRRTVSTKAAGAFLGAPFQPRTLLTSDPISIDAPFPSSSDSQQQQNINNNIVPLQIVTGQIMVRGLVSQKRMTTTASDYEHMSHLERTKHYFCGTDWHDASQKCGTPCPSGTAEECPNNERCYADTPCDSSDNNNNNNNNNNKKLYEHDVHEDNYHLTPGGGLPSCFTVWSDGRITMHSLTSLKHDTETGGDEEEEEEEDGNGNNEESNNNNNNNNKNKNNDSFRKKLQRTLKRARNYSKNKKSPRLELRSMWTAQSLPHMPNHIQDFSKAQLTYLDSYDTPPTLAKHGMIIVSGDLTPTAEQAPVRELGSPPVDPMTMNPRFMVALDAMTGQVLWDSLQNFQTERTTAEQLPLPIQLQRGRSSLARRRSKVVNLDTAMSSTTATTTDVATDADNNTTMDRLKKGMLPNCLEAYRYSLLGATETLPYAYWGPADAGVRAVHLDHSNTQRKFARHNQHHAHKHSLPWSSSTSSSQNHKPGLISPHQHQHRHLQNKHNNNNNNKKKKKDLTTKTKPSWHSALFNPRKRMQHGGHVHYGRPNVVVNYHAGGLHVHSLQNGQPLCHLSLNEETLYVDVQRDGVMDSIQIVTNGKNLVLDPLTGTYADPWVAKLAAKLDDATASASAADTSKKNKDDNSSESKFYHLMHRFCHALALSGNPPREELFSTPLCSASSSRGKNNNDQNHPWGQVYAAPPLVVESLYSQHRHREKDVIIAMSNGIVSRIRGGTGRRQWKLDGHRNAAENFPTWGDWEATHTVSLTQLQVNSDSDDVANYARPILLVGESSLAILSATYANVLASTNIPQRSIRRPIVADINGDGVSDVLIATADAIWGYEITIRTGASIFFRILVGLLLMGILLAILRNRYGGTSARDRYKRSTDAY